MSDAETNICTAIHRSENPFSDRETIALEVHINIISNLSQSSETRYIPARAIDDSFFLSRFAKKTESKVCLLIENYR
jgi:hypothetical protein